MITQTKDYLQKLILRIIAAVIIISPLMYGLFQHSQWIIIQFIISLALFIEMWRRVLKGQEGQRISYFDLLNLALIFLYFLSLAWAFNKHGAYTTAYRYLTCYFVYYLAINNIDSKRDRNFLVWSIFISAALTALLAFLGQSGYHLFGIAALDSVRLSGSFGYPNSFAAFLGLAFILGLDLLQKDYSRPVRGLLYAGSYLMVAGILGSQSRGTFLFLLTALLFLTIWHILRKQNVVQYIFNYFLITALATFGLSAYLLPYKAGQANKGLLFLAAGGLLLIVAGFLTDFLLIKIENLRKDTSFKGLVLFLLLFYLAGIGVFYFTYIDKADPAAGSVFFAQDLSRFTEISGEEGSYTGRMTYNKDALKIIKAYPFGSGGGGWDSIYHQFQTHEYWSKEVHNNFLNIGVEAGIAGLLIYLGLVFLLFYTAWRLYRTKRAEDRETHFTLAMGLAFLLAHSAMDFDLSFGSMQILVMVLAALLLYRDRSRRLEVTTLKLKPWVWQLLSLVVLFFFILPSGAELASEYYTKQAYKAYDLDKIIANYEKAAFFSPLNENSRSLLARKEAEKFLQTGDNYHYDRVNQLTDEVIKLAPRDIWSLMNLQDAHFYLKNQRKLLELRQREADILPRIAASNAALGDEYIKTALFLLKEGEDQVAAASLFAQAQDTIEAYINAPKLNPYLKDKAKLVPALQHSLVQGKLAYLEGSYEESLSLFKKVSWGNFRDEALLWQVASLIKADRLPEAEKLINSIKNQDLLYDLNNIVNRGGAFALSAEGEENGK